ncbi:XRE family transcriptional regulator [Streptomyces sp. NPDC005227]|uniref:XRE family transcriptional regulator n=1 Tax=Streptomyces sp. NPDC005227 TaxID=3364707 RepID=UPI00368B9149
MATYRLNTQKLRDKAAERGDEGPEAIIRRTRINSRSVYRILGGHQQPDLNSALKIAAAYDFDLRTVMDEVPEEDIEASA